MFGDRPIDTECYPLEPPEGQDEGPGTNPKYNGLRSQGETRGENEVIQEVRKHKYGEV